MEIFIYSTYLFLLQLPFLPTQALFNQSHFFWKSEVKYTGVDITCFFQDAKSSLTKHKKCFWRRLIEPVILLSCRLLQKMLTAYSRKQFLRRKSSLDVKRS